MCACTRYCLAIKVFVRFVQAPATLFAWVDPSVGGKTAINNPHGKKHCGDRIILPGRQNWEQIVKILPKSCDPTVWNGKMWFGKIQTICHNILPPHQSSPAPAVKLIGSFWHWSTFNSTPRQRSLITYSPLHSPSPGQTARKRVLFLRVYPPRSSLPFNPSTNFAGYSKATPWAAQVLYL